MTERTNNYMTDFIDIETAIKLTKTSDSTIRRFLRNMKQEDKDKYLTREGKKVVIERKYLLRSFDVNEDFVPEDRPAASGKTAKPASVPFDLVEFQRQQLTEKDKQIGKLQDHNDRLLSDLKEKDQDLKASWSMISNLQEETKQLTASVKALKQAEQVEDKAASKYNTLLFVLVVVIAFIAIYIVVTS